MRKIKETIVSVGSTETKTERIIEDFDPKDEVNGFIKRLACLFGVTLGFYILAIFGIIFGKTDGIFNGLKDFSQAVLPLTMLFVYGDRQRKIMQDKEVSIRTFISFIISLALLVVIHFSI